MKNIRLLPFLDLITLNSRRPKSKFNHTKKWFLIVVGLTLSLVFILCVTNKSKRNDSSGNDKSNSRNHLQHYHLTTAGNKKHQSFVNEAQTHHTKPIGLATTVTSKPKFVGRRKLIASSSSLLDTCLHKLATKCQKSGNKNKESTIFPIVTVLLQTLTNHSGTTGTLSRREKILSAYTTKSLMASSFDNLLTNIASLEAVDDRINNKKKKKRLELFGMVLSQMNVLVQVIQFYLHVINRSNKSSPVDTTRNTALNCEIDTMTTTNTTTTSLREMIESLQKATSTVMDDTITMYTSDSDSVTGSSDRTILEDILTITIQILFGILVMVGGIVYIVFSPVLFVFYGTNYLFMLILLFLTGQICFDPFDDVYDGQYDDPYEEEDDTDPCSDRFQLNGISSLLVDVGMTRIEMEQLEQCSKTFAANTATTTLPPKVRIGHRDKKFIKEYWTNTILKSDAMQSILEQLSRFQNTPSAELFVCEYKLAICETQ